ncbi:astacin-like [Anopheles cruzii]|uniref:astacin-like n=1 Tax=Anopheles cruzii TaxID=68878 RepID=UPI0022EC58ED|nr:astacin-like [Anopheles cruzii]
MVTGSGILFAASLVLFASTALDAAYVTSPSFLVGERLRSYRSSCNVSSTRRRPFELGAGIYREMDIMEKVPRQRNGISLSVGPTSRWPNAVVPYVITGSFTAAQQAVIMAAIAQYTANTCVRFVARTTESLYVSITNTATGCWSYVGRSLSNSENIVNLQTPDCVDVGTAAHELMHSIGFYHEHTRPDRDSYVSIDRSALATEYQTATFYTDNFGIMSASQVVLYGRPYDYGSVMHYSKYAGAASNSRPVMNNLKPWTGDFGNDNGLSASDIIEINYMYCNATTSTVAAATTKAPTTVVTTTAAPAATSTSQPALVSCGAGSLLASLLEPLNKLIQQIGSLPIFQLFG